MTGAAPDAPRRLTDRLGFRLAALLSLALLPVGLIAVSQSAYLMREARARSEAAILGATLRAALPQLRLIRLAQGTAASLAGVASPLLKDGAGPCSAALGDVVAGSAIFSDAVFYRRDGSVACSAAPGTRGIAGTASLAAMRAAGGPTLLAGAHAPVSDASILTAVHDVKGAAGETLGYMTVSLPQGRLASALSVASIREDLTLVLFGVSGDVLSSNRARDRIDELLPVGRRPDGMAQGGDSVFEARDASGESRSFAVIRLSDDGLVALGSWPVEGPLLPVFAKVPAALFPALMWGVSLVAAWLAAEGLVGRHVRRLRGAITSFAGGNRVVSGLDMAGAPLEIRDAADAFEQMTDSILHDEAELENTIHQKEVLLREVHHRVKNNLQLIASIMNMQMRKTRSEEAKVLMKGLQDRVMSLATIHRGLYQTSGLTDVRTDELFPDILRQVVRMATAPGRAMRVASHFDDLRLTPDQAVPLALLLTEALTNAMKYGVSEAGPAAGTSWLEVRLERDGPGHAVLRLANSVPEAVAANTGGEEAGGLGTQLIAAFVQQLAGEADSGTAGGVYRLTVRFPVRPLAEGEARNAAPEPAET